MKTDRLWLGPFFSAVLVCLGISLGASVAFSRPEGESGSVEGGSACPLLGEEAYAGFTYESCVKDLVVIDISIGLPQWGIEFAAHVPLPWGPRGKQLINVYRCVGMGKACLLGTTRLEPVGGCM
ncbi:hypothetical protein SAMN04488087_1698 [Rhodothermus profundi]|uniref:Uncharacterized protein n=1 Tax=Rhodothermus profundi TaxID=633813 RepID=A0A1M6UGR3_9BACT|nr:hypothetical protein SAMN04488087_1698 [Rhodothermus profundi]